MTFSQDISGTSIKILAWVDPRPTRLLTYNLAMEDPLDTQAVCDMGKDEPRLSSDSPHPGIMQNASKHSQDPHFNGGTSMVNGSCGNIYIVPVKTLAFYGSRVPTSISVQRNGQWVASDANKVVRKREREKFAMGMISVVRCLSEFGAYTKPPSLDPGSNFIIVSRITGSKKNKVVARFTVIFTSWKSTTWPHLPESERMPRVWSNPSKAYMTTKDDVGFASVKYCTMGLKL
ncbi:hypothetical protein DFS33DRAFT_1277143 [Desarmillaria ectypa]|nr:hypothetical protein DFS33DRAFT_1277143 [Desarmillaria ectypa]